MATKHSVKVKATLKGKKVVFNAFDGALNRTMVSYARNILNMLKTPNGETGTPVDTGLTISNWYLSIGRPSRGFKGTKENVKESDGNLGLLDGYKIAQGKLYITNNTPYLTYIRSKKSPTPITDVPNFVDNAIDRAYSELMLRREKYARTGY